MQYDYSALEKIFEPELITEIKKLEVFNFPKGFVFDRNSDAPGGVPIVIKGKIEVTKQDEKGRRFNIYNISKGESCIIALDAIIQSSKNIGQEGIVVEDTQTVLVSANLSELWIDKFPSWRKFIFNLFSKRLKDLITQQGIVTEQRDQISQKNEKISNSIKYAGRIQQAVLPAEAYMQQILPDYFVLNRPRNIVSGDFYWVEQKEQKLIIVVADSTGHGVPGAFMSMLGVSMLSEIVNKEIDTGANQILNKLRERIKASLKQTGEQNEQKDGFDMALCIIDTEKNNLHFAGAYNPLLLIRKGELIEIKADRMPVGIYIKEKDSFTLHQKELQKGDLIYLFSDGFADQLGGENNQKFKIRNFKNLLVEISSKPLSEQKQILTQTFDNWKGNQNQTDDMLVMGIKIN